MYCNWIIDIYNCDNSNDFIKIEKIGLIIHFIVCFIGIIISIFRKKYLWKGLYTKNNGYMPIECFLILSLIFFLIRIIYMIYKIKANSFICSILYGLGWLPGIYSYNIYYIKVINYSSNYIDIKYIYIPNIKIIINFIKLQIFLISIISIIFSILSCLYLNNINMYYIYFGIVQFSIGLGILIIGIISLFYGIQQLRFKIKYIKENSFYDENSINSIHNISLILIFISVFAIPVSIFWFYTSIRFEKIIKNNIFSIILFVIWDILCAPFAIIITYTIILFDTKRNYRKINTKIESLTYK